MSSISLNPSIEYWWTFNYHPSLVDASINDRGFMKTFPREV